MPEYIDRDYVRKFATYTHRKSGVEPIKVVPLKFIEDAPAADVEPVRHGRWIFRPKKLGLRPGYRCSECPNGPLWLAPDVPQAFKYCPHCGAKMDEEAK